MEKVDFLPLGSVVVIKGGVRKAVIIARGLAAAIGGEMRYFDYGGCLYPEGMIGDSMLYFNHENISKVVYKGYTDDDDRTMVDNVNEWVEKSQLKKGDPYELNRQNQKG